MNDKGFEIAFKIYGLIIIAYGVAMIVLVPWLFLLGGLFVYLGYRFVIG